MTEADESAPPPPLPTLFDTQELEAVGMRRIIVEREGHYPFTVIAAHSYELASAVRERWGTRELQRFVQAFCNLAARKSLDVPSPVLKALATLASAHGSPERPPMPEALFIEERSLHRRGHI